MRVPYADQGLNKITDSVTDEQALFVGDILATGFWATRISEITEEDTVLIIGAGPTRYLHPAVCYAEAAEAHHHLRKMQPERSLSESIIPMYCFASLRNAKPLLRAFRPWRCGRCSGGCRRSRHLPARVEMRASERYRNGCGALR